MNDASEAARTSPLAAPTATPAAPKPRQASTIAGHHAHTRSQRTSTKKLKAKGIGKVTDIDGIRLDLGDGWGLVRASNTQPVIVLRFEAKTKARLEEIRSMVEGALQATAKELGHPPIDTAGGGGH